MFSFCFLILLFLWPCYIGCYEDYGDEFGFLNIPTVSFDSGNYYGQQAYRESNREPIPHGIGSYISQEGRVVYAGRWFRGWMHGLGQRYFEDGTNYTGNFVHNQLHGRGQIQWPNGTKFKGEFIHNKPSGKGKMTYPNGDVRDGSVFNGVWKGTAEFSDSKDGTKWLEHWTNNGTYQPSVKIMKKVENNYTDVAVKLVCKAHGRNLILKLFKEDELVQKKLSRDFPHRETIEIIFPIPFRDESFRLYTCRVEDSLTEQIIVEDMIQVRNPFFLESHGECGLQLVNMAGKFEKNRKRKRRMVSNYFRPRVVGGRHTGRGEVPWQALIQVDYTPKGSNISLGNHCGGTIISPWHVLTAAHCMEIPEVTNKRRKYFDPREIKVKLGYTTVPISLNGEIYSVSKVYVHPDYDPNGWFNDIALLVLKSKINIGKYVNPVCLPSLSQFSKIKNSLTDLELTISGFGLTFNHSDMSKDWHFPSHLQVAKIKYLDIGHCFNQMQELAIKFKGHFCAGAGPDDDDDTRSPLGFKPDSCQGDSGGPATFSDEMYGRHYLVGLVSAGPRVCGTSNGAVYVNVTHYLDWINQVKIHDLVQDYMQGGEGKAVPYEKIDSSIFKAIFEFLAIKEDSILSN